MRSSALAVALSFLASACGGGDDNDGNGEEPLTIARIQSEIFAPSCNQGLCHATPAGGNLVLASASTSYANLVDQPPAGQYCADSGIVRVVPNDPDSSLLYLKLSANPPCGDQMPVAGLLEESKVALIRQWIEEGAPPE